VRRIDKSLLARIERNLPVYLTASVRYTVENDYTPREKGIGGTHTAGTARSNQEEQSMASQATCTFEGKTWDESAYDEPDGLPKLARVSATNTYSGGIEGTGTVEYLMMYQDSGTASFVGLERITGRIGERAGSFVVQHTGNYKDQTATVSLTVVQGSGTGELAGLRGSGGFAAHGTQVPR